MHRLCLILHVRRLKLGQLCIGHLRYVGEVDFLSSSSLVCMLIIRLLRNTPCSQYPQSPVILGKPSPDRPQPLKTESLIEYERSRIGSNHSVELQDPEAEAGKLAQRVLDQGLSDSFVPHGLLHSIRSIRYMAGPSYVVRMQNVQACKFAFIDGNRCIALAAKESRSRYAVKLLVWGKALPSSTISFQSPVMAGISCSVYALIVIGGVYHKPACLAFGLCGTLARRGKRMHHQSTIYVTPKLLMHQSDALQSLMGLAVDCTVSLAYPKDARSDAQVLCKAHPFLSSCLQADRANTVRQCC